MRSPFLPEMRAQSSGLVVLGRSSFSLDSSTHEAKAEVEGVSKVSDASLRCEPGGNQGRTSSAAQGPRWPHL